MKKVNIIEGRIDFNIKSILFYILLSLTGFIYVAGAGWKYSLSGAVMSAVFLAIVTFRNKYIGMLYRIGLLFFFGIAYLYFLGFKFAHMTETQFYHSNWMLDCSVCIGAYLPLVYWLSLNNIPGNTLQKPSRVYSLFPIGHRNPPLHDWQQHNLSRITLITGSAFILSLFAVFSPNVVGSPRHAIYVHILQNLENAHAPSSGTMDQRLQRMTIYTGLALSKANPKMMTAHLTVLRPFYPFKAGTVPTKTAAIKQKLNALLHSEKLPYAKLSLAIVLQKTELGWTVIHAHNSPSSRVLRLRYAAKPASLRVLYSPDKHPISVVKWIFRNHLYTYNMQGAYFVIMLLVLVMLMNAKSIKQFWISIYASSAIVGLLIAQYIFMPILLFSRV